MTKKTKKISTREWILIIIILSLTQFLIHWLSMKYGGSASALGYVSFAGTVVSILLGLIAIVYSFVQSISQNSSAVEISEQIKRLITAGEDITKSKEELLKSASILSGIIDNLGSQLKENTNATNKIAGIFSDAKTILSSDPKSKDATDEKSYSIFSSNRVWISIACICIGEAIKRKWTLDNVQTNIIEPLANEIGITEDLASGVLLGIVLCLESEGFISYKDDNPEEVLLDVGKFQTRLNELIPDTLGSKHKEFHHLWNIVNNL